MGRKKITEKYFMMRLDSFSESALKILSKNTGKSQASVIRSLLIQASADKVGAINEPKQTESLQAN